MFYFLYENHFVFFFSRRQLTLAQLIHSVARHVPSGRYSTTTGPASPGWPLFSHRLRSKLRRARYARYGRDETRRDETRRDKKRRACGGGSGVSVLRQQKSVCLSVGRGDSGRL